MAVCFCTLAIHAAYRRRAQLLCADIPDASWVVLTDEPGDFAALPVRAIRHVPTGPMAIDYLERLPPTGAGRGGSAYHDKRFALLAALENCDTAIYIDADSRIRKLPRLRRFPKRRFPKGLAVLPVVRENLAEHLDTWGSSRLPAFSELACHLTGDDSVLQTARWCPEALVAVTRDGNEARFFEAWGVGAEFMQSRGVYSGEGGVIGLAAACAGWNVNYDALTRIAKFVHHEGGGPKKD